MKSAIVGCGGISQVHARVLHDMEGVELVAFADIKPEKAQAMVEKYGGAAYTSLEEMLEKEKFDVLHICTPHYLHVPMAKAAMAKGIHVLMEKPPAMTREEMKEILAFQAEHPEVTLGVSFQNRYNGATCYVKELLESGKAGAVKGARAIVTWSRGDKYYTESGWRGTWATEGGGVLINQSIHTLDMLIHLLGQPKAVEAHICNHHLKGVIEVEDTAEAYVDFGDTTALFYATTAFCTDAPVLVEVVCENMTLQLGPEDVWVLWPDGKKEHVEFDTSTVFGKGYWGGGHNALIHDLYECIETGKEFRLNIKEATKALDLMLGIYESSRAGAPITL